MGMNLKEEDSCWLERSILLLGGGGGLGSVLVFVEEKAKAIMASKTMKATTNGFMAPSIVIIFNFIVSFRP
jgi:hypothetical protein